MTSLDTNIVVRLITRDDPAQAQRAAALVRARACWLAKTVVLETEWVLRAAYGYTRPQTLEALERLTSMVNLAVEDHAAVEAALVWHGRGVDFADALHLASSCDQDAFATYDARLRELALEADASPVVLAP